MLEFLTVNISVRLQAAAQHRTPGHACRDRLAEEGGGGVLVQLLHQAARAGGQEIPLIVCKAIPYYVGGDGVEDERKIITV